MTKKQMIDLIERSGMVINFSRAYYNRMLKEQIKPIYERALAYIQKRG
jgi:hypothetical protein